MKNKISTSILYVFLVSAYPVLAMLGYNTGEADPADGMRALIAALLFGLLLLLIFRLVLREWSRAALASAGLIVLFFSYGHLYSLLKTTQVAGFVPGKHSLMLPLWAILGAAWIWVAARQVKRPAEAARFFNAAGVVLLILPIYSITSHEIQAALYRQERAAAQASPHRSIDLAAGELPDIYYIILDGYARADVLQELYDYDNRAFLQGLAERGFYLAGESYSNYNQTALSIASSLNMTYVNYLTEEMGVDNKKRLPLVGLIRESELRRVLDEKGYEVIGFETGYEITEMRGSDHLWSLKSEVVPTITSLWRFNGFEALLLESTLMRAVFDLHIFEPDSLRQFTLNPEYQAHRERVLYTLDRLDDPAVMEGNYLVFAHILTPHPPFVFGPNGEELFPDGAYQIADGDNYPGDPEGYLEGYRNQVEFISAQITQAIDRILEKSQTPPIIILQADHGPGSQLVWESPEESNLQERFGILNAYYFPDGDYSALYPAISPVNTFRVVLNQYFGGAYDLLPDEHYFAPWMRPYEFHPVTDLLK